MSFTQRCVEKVINSYNEIHQSLTGSQLFFTQLQCQERYLIIRGNIKFTPEELRYMASRAGQNLVKQVRMQMLNEAKQLMLVRMSETTGKNVCDSYVEVDVESAELTQIFLYEEPISEII